MRTYLIPTSPTLHLMKKLKDEIKDVEIIFPDLTKEGKRYFPDRELYIKIRDRNKLRGKRVVVLHSGAPNPNEGLIELELILQILKDSKAKPIEVFFLYFPYSMQDTVFEKGETNIAENLVEKLVNYYKVEKIYTIDPHFKGRKWVRKYPIFSISALPLLVTKAKKDFGKDILFLSPDSGGTRRTKISGMQKERIDSYRVKITSPKKNLKGKIVAVVDDMIKTGGTLLKFYEIAKRAGVKKVIALVSHGVLSSGISKIKEKYSKLYLTNTIKQKGVSVDITDLILKTIKDERN